MGITYTKKYSIVLNTDFPIPNNLVFSKKYRDLNFQYICNVFKPLNLDFLALFDKNGRKNITTILQNVCSISSKSSISKNRVKYYSLRRVNLHWKNRKKQKKRLFSYSTVLFKVSAYF